MSRSENNLNAVFTDIANTLRSKKHTEDTFIPRDFADTIASLSSRIYPDTFDATSGYVYLSSGQYQWIPQDNDNNRTDVFHVKAGKTYIFFNYSLISAIGIASTSAQSSRWRGIFTTANPTSSTSTVVGTMVAYLGSTPKGYETFTIYTPSTDGYITIMKTNKVDTTASFTGVGMEVIMFEL